MMLCWATSYVVGRGSAHSIGLISGAFSAACSVSLSDLQKISRYNLCASVRDYGRRNETYLKNGIVQESFKISHAKHERLLRLQSERQNAETELEITGNVFTQQRAKMYANKLRNGSLEKLQETTKSGDIDVESVSSGTCSIFKESKHFKFQSPPKNTMVWKKLGEIFDINFSTISFCYKETIQTYEQELAMERINGSLKEVSNAH